MFLKMFDGDWMQKTSYSQIGNNAPPLFLMKSTIGLCKLCTDGGDSDVMEKESVPRVSVVGDAQGTAGREEVSSEGMGCTDILYMLSPMLFSLHYFPRAIFPPHKPSLTGD